MKKLPIAAAALLFGTSAYAMASSKDAQTVTGANAVGAATTDAARLEPAAVDWWGAAAPVATKAASDEFAATDEEWDAIAAAKADTDREAAVEPEAEPVSAETTVLDEEPVPVEDGVGGPYVGVDTASADLTPRPAAQNYPACRPGPGDDNCIQLYEPGVRAQLASWDQPTGGFAGTAGTQVAMGGPYEAADDSAVEADAASVHEAAMHGDGRVDAALGETADDEELAEV